MSYEPDKKDNTSIAVSEAGDDHLAVHLPASLQNLSEEERAALAKSGTRKIDLMLLPCLTLLYLLNFLDRQSKSFIQDSANIRPLVGQDRGHFKESAPDDTAVRDRRRCAVRGLRRAPDPLQHDREQGPPAGPLHLLQRRPVGDRVGVHGGSARPRRTVGMPSDARSRRGSVLPWRHLPRLALLHPPGDGLPRRRVLHRFTDR